ncbi:MAG: hypothetical protein JST53_11925, partial [Actinobacteria bacterium]|nr:hypothetical protein [Actinomycetota bacterium]
MTMRALRRLAAPFFVSGVFLMVMAAAAGAAPPLETVRLQRIELPPSVENAAQPVYSSDGEHLLFFANVVADGELNPDPARGP